MQFELKENIPDEQGNENIDEKGLVPATDEEIHEAIERALDELYDEIETMFSDEAMEAEDDPEFGDFLDEFEKAETVDERTAVMDKYHISY